VKSIVQVAPSELVTAAAPSTEISRNPTRGGDDLEGVRAGDADRQPKRIAVDDIRERIGDQSSGKVADPEAARLRNDKSEEEAVRQPDRGHSLGLVREDDAKP
jgi:hypothetical protein